MFSNGYVGTAEDANRIRRQEKQREAEKRKHEALHAEKQAELAGLRTFAPTTDEAMEHAFKNETIGFQTRADYVKKRTTMAERMEEEQRKKAEAEAEALQREKERKRLLKQGAGSKKLSFVMDDEEEDGEEGSASPAPAPFKLPFVAATAAAGPGSSGGAAPKAAEGGAASNGGGAAGNGEAGGSGQGGEAAQASGRSASPAVDGPDAKRPRKLGKNPDAPTSFLPDRDRARKEQELREQLKREYLAQQDTIKAEPLCIVYSYWDGAGHRREIKVKKGDTIGAFLKGVRDQLSPEFRELRHVSVDNLLYVKEDIILPHHYTFYHLIQTKARGKSGPLFDFGVHEDIRVVSDASREKNESHAGKVVERHWYDRNKHIFPASRWEVFDPEKKYDTYTIYGD